MISLVQRKDLTHEVLDAYSQTMSRANCRHPNPQRYRAYRCIECVRASKRRHFRKKQNYDGWFQRQAGLCAFCGLAMVYEDNATCLDHDHVTGVERGLVHAQCNQAVGGSELAIRLIGLPRLLDYLGIR
jgi:hypothetical protein